MGRHCIKNTVFFKTVEYIATGQAEEYKKQMNLQTKLLNDQTTNTVVVPLINYEQGPLMHMNITDNADAWTNNVVEEFYNKDYVIAIPRNEWNEKYNPNE